MTIKEYCESNEKCKDCLIEGLCKGTDRQKYKPRDYSYPDDVCTTHELLMLLKILSEK